MSTIPTRPDDSQHRVYARGRRALTIAIWSTVALVAVLVAAVVALAIIRPGGL